MCPDTPAPRVDRSVPARLATRWAVVSLGATLLSGLWLRSALTWPGVGGGVNLLYAVHAHSHVAFFGWVVLSVAALAVRQCTLSPAQQTIWRFVVHALGALSLMALVGFARMGYATPTIVLSAMHVMLWIPLVSLLWSMPHASAPARAWWRTAFVALLAAGAVTIIPAIFAARGIREGWWRELGIKLFLALFINGFAGFASLGLLVARDAREDRLAWARTLLGVTVAPLAILYVSTPPPEPWLLWVARAAVGVMSIATLAVVRDAWSTPRTPWIRVALLAWTLIGVLQLVAALGIGSALIHERPVVLAFTHLVLLVAVSPVLATSLARQPVVAWRPWLATIGAAVMCATLAALGWPWLGALSSRIGLGPLSVMRVLAITSAVTAFAWLALLPLLFTAHAREESP